MKRKTRIYKASTTCFFDSHDILQSGFEELPITAQHAATILTLKNIHRDPFDRMLIAQAVSEPLTLLTSDIQLKSYSSTIEYIEK